MKKIHRFIGSWPLAHGNVRIDDAALVHQLRDVLKLAPAEEVILGTGQGIEARCTILAYQGDAVVVTVVDIGENPNEPRGTPVLYCAVLKSEHLELAVQKTTEVGVKEIVPVLSRRTVKLGVRQERLEKIAREAAELAGRGNIPVIAPPMEFDRALTHAHQNDVNYFLDPSGTPIPGTARGNARIGIWIGPEGGWDPAELGAAESYGMRTTSLGPLILRAETAAIVATYLVVAALQSKR